MAQLPSGRRNPGYLAAAVLVAALLVSASLLLVNPGSARTVTRTSTETETHDSTVTLTETSNSTVTLTQTTTIPDYVAINDSGDAALLAHCSPAQVNSPSFGTLAVASGSPAILCMQVYDFIPASPIILNSSGLLSIQGVRAGIELPTSGENFTVITSQDQFLLAGPLDTNEGAIVAFAVTSKPGASGTYALGIRGTELGASEPLDCASFGKVVAGSGQPDYAIIGGCITYISSSANPSFTIPGVGYNIMSNVLYFRIISLINSTQ